MPKTKQFQINIFLSSSFFFAFFVRDILSWYRQLLHNLKTLSIADMGVIPYELLVPLGQLKALNLSGNHLVNVSMQILHPVVGLEVSRQALEQLFYWTIEFNLDWLSKHAKTIDFLLCDFFPHSISYFQLLDISRNQLNGIEDSQAIMLQKIKEVRLENNPLICDRCHMGSLIQMVKHVSRFANCFYTFYTNRTVNSFFLAFFCIDHYMVFNVVCDFLFALIHSLNGVCIQFVFYPNP